MSLFGFDSYKGFIRSKIKENSEVYGYQSRLAEAAKCQRSFLSQVLSKEVHLTVEQAMGLCEFWKFGNDEQEYFLLLVQSERAGTESLKRFFERKLEGLLAKQKNLTDRFKETAQSEKDNEIYYGSWHFAAIHGLVSIPSFQTVESISARLALPLKEVEATLSQLLRMGLVEKKGSRFRVGKTSLHLPKGSRFTPIFQAQWRNRAIMNSLEQNSDSLHYTSIVTISKKDLKRFEDMALRFLDETRALIAPSEDEEMVCFLMDLFKV
jgi:uncharacterized protein (TIGR02147 family)